MVDATGATVDNEAELVAASARFLCPLASSYLAVSVQDLMTADTRARPAHGRTQRTSACPGLSACAGTRSGFRCRRSTSQLLCFLRLLHTEHWFEEDD